MMREIAPRVALFGLTQPRYSGKYQSHRTRTPRRNKLNRWEGGGSCGGDRIVESTSEQLYQTHDAWRCSDDIACASSSPRCCQAQRCSPFMPVFHFPSVMFQRYARSVCGLSQKWKRHLNLSIIVVPRTAALCQLPSFLGLPFTSVCGRCARAVKHFAFLIPCLRLS